ncbi:MAG: transposase [Mobilitalea sp.]
MRKRYYKEFKAKVAVEALKGEKTLQELAITYSVHPKMIALWKRQLLENASTLFEKEGKDKASEEAERQKDELFKQIGQLQVENEFLKKKYKQLYGTEPKW